MLVKQVNGQFAIPLGVVVAPCHHVADDLHLGIFRADGLVELFVALVVVVTLLTRVRLVVFVTYLQIFYSERLRMSVPGTHSTVFRCDGTVSILQGIHALVDPRLDAVIRSHAPMPYSHIHHIKRLGP